MTDDTRALIDQTDDFRRRGMDGAVASNERVLAGRVPALLDRIEALEGALDEARWFIRLLVNDLAPEKQSMAQTTIQRATLILDKQKRQHPGNAAVKARRTK